MQLTSTDMKRLRSVQLDLLQQVQELCHRHAITYFAVAGTALGAVRHQGFIPWDDDVDVAMPRPDYERFLNVARCELGADYFLQHSRTDPNFPLPMAKVRRNNSRFMEQATVDVNMHHGIFVDVFPLDRKPRSAGLQTLHAALLKLLSRLCRLRAGYAVEFPRPWMSSWLRASLQWIPIRWLTRLQEWAATAFREATGGLTVVGGTYPYHRERFDDAWLSDLVITKFEHLSVPIFREFDTYLTHLYGDYMTLPPESHRVSHHSVADLSFPKP